MKLSSPVIAKLKFAPVGIALAFISSSVALIGSNQVASKLGTAPGAPGSSSDEQTRYTFTNASGDGEWSTPTNWKPLGPPPSGIDCGSHVNFGDNATTVKLKEEEIPVSGVHFLKGGWVLDGSGQSKVFTHEFTSAGADGDNRINIGCRTTPAVPATFKVEDKNWLVMNGGVSGEGRLIKQGPGTLVLKSINDFTGSTEIQSGTVLIQGSVTKTSSLSIAPQGVLHTSGECIVNGNVVNDGVIDLARLKISGTLTNKGVIISTPEDILPAKWENYGVVFTPSESGWLIRNTHVSLTDGRFTVTFRGYWNYGFQLQHADTPDGPWSDVGASQNAAELQHTPDGAKEFTFSDTVASTSIARFYRVTAKPLVEKRQ